MRKLALFLMSIVFGITALAQDIEPLVPPTGFEPLAITFPVPAIYISGDLPIVGTVNLNNLSNYFIEIREIQPRVEGALEVPWTPATLPSRTPIANSVIGILDTTLFPDGLYEIRLAATTSTGREYFRVSPIRIVNDPMAVSPYLALLMSMAGEGGSSAPVPTVTSESLAFPTAVPSLSAPTNPTPTGPYVQAFVNANVRQGDSTAYPIVGNLPNGSTAPIIGISTTGSGWFYIQLSNGVRGFISPTTVTAVGNTIGVPPVAPPPAPPTAIPTATSTATNTPIPFVTPTPTFTPSITPTPTATSTLIFIPVTLVFPILPTATPFIFVPITLIPISTP